ncbi:MAG TPA: two-component regulator propeller domain-containing protein [Bryobacteraceae bacterium]|nr:two-component regulator propeller domain-containing protein [Bryobacteraceae bacterium]
MCHPGRLGAAAFLFVLARGLIAAGPPAHAPATPPGPDEFGRQIWETENGLPQNTVHSILQSQVGYIWVGTEGGLARFDGLKFAVFNAQNTPSLKSNNIRTLAETRDGSLWIATADGIARFKEHRFSSFTTDDGLPSNNVWSLSEDRAGTLWAVTAEGLARFSGSRFQPSAVPGAATLTGAIAADNRGTLWVGTRNGVRTLGTSAPPEKRNQSRPANNDIEQILIDSRETRWMGTSNGLYAFKNGDVKVYTAESGLPANRITALFEDTDHNIWVGTDAGLARIVNGAVVPLSASDAWHSETILSITQDREGDIWVGTASNGLGVLRPQRFATYTVRNGLSDDLVRCVFQDREGVIWIGTNAGGLTRYQNGHFSSFTTRDGLASDVILALAQGEDGSLLVGTPDGLNLIRGNAVTLLTSADGLPDDFVRSILADREGRLWIGTRRGLACRKDGRFTIYGEADGLGSDLVGAILADGDGGLWIATLHGLTRFQNGKLRNYTTKDGLSSDTITALYRDDKGVLWIGTQDGGLNGFIEGKFVRFPAALNLPTAIDGVAEDLDQDLWISSNVGIYRVSRRELLRFAAGQKNQVTAISYGTSDGLRISESSGGGHPAIWRAHDGSLWFATLKGVAEMRGPQPRLNRVPPGIVIESVSIDDQTVDPGQLTSIRPGHSRVAFQYTGLSFAAPQKVRFRYKLEGFDRNWVDAGTRRVAYYTNLPPGKYRFRVLACNNDGFWNESGAALAFRLEPHFYQTYWFDALMLVGLALVAWSGYRWRVRQVEAQFDAVLQERNRIAREIHDTLAQGFAGVSVQLELVSRLLASSADAAREHLDQARVLVRRSLADARSSIWELRLQSAEREDLAARLSKMANQVTGSGPAKLELQIRGAYRPLAPKVENELLKIAQEALTNAVRHANAERINLELAFDAGKLRMTIADNGQGFAGVPNSSGPDGHFGLRGMRERAEEIDAELKVQTAAGKGTVISVEAMVN